MWFVVREMVVIVGQNGVVGTQRLADNALHRGYRENGSTRDWCYTEMNEILPEENGDERIDRGVYTSTTEVIAVQI